MTDYAKPVSAVIFINTLTYVIHALGSSHEKLFV